MLVSRRDLIKLLGLSAGAYFINGVVPVLGALPKSGTLEFAGAYAVTAEAWGTAAFDILGVSKEDLSRQLLFASLRAGAKPTGRVTTVVVEHPDSFNGYTPPEDCIVVGGRCSSTVDEVYCEALVNSAEQEILEGWPPEYVDETFKLFHLRGLAEGRVLKGWMEEYRCLT